MLTAVEVVSCLPRMMQDQGAVSVRQTRQRRAVAVQCQLTCAVPQLPAPVHFRLELVLWGMVNETVTVKPLSPCHQALLSAAAPEAVCSECRRAWPGVSQPEGKVFEQRVYPTASPREKLLEECEELLTHWLATLYGLDPLSSVVEPPLLMQELLLLVDSFTIARPSTQEFEFIVDGTSDAYPPPSRATRATVERLQTLLDDARLLATRER